MKRFAQILLCSIITISGTTAISTSTSQAASGQVSIMLDDYSLPFPVQPTVMNETTMVPFRAISEALGVKVVWNQAKQEITASKTGTAGTKQVVLTMGSKNAVVDGQVVKLIASPQTVQGSTLIPLSFFSSQFGATVAWNQATKTVSITSPKEDIYTMGFYALSSFDERSMVSSFDSVAFGWSRIDKDGQFTTQGKEYRWPQAAGTVTPESIIQETDQQGTTPYLMVYSVDGGLELTKNLEDMTLQNQTITAIVDTASQKGFKGVVLDLEGLGWSGDKAKARSDYNAFIKNLSSKTDQAGLKLSIVLHPLNSSYTGYDYRTLASLADDLIIMGYAFEDEKSPEPLVKVDEAITLALKEVGKDKLILGISLGSENEQSVNAKIGLAKRYGLKGIAIWRIGIIGQSAWTEMNKSVFK
ncbi:stalk domain-containing protein [Paenibacillus macquariensis]|uniref:Glycosyl hydrolases family 18 n=1 Tax=Paenibacillus macquariensis TaxID=948756 RepID=A0ABY1K8M7_9BACL|nr:stalk domain-containing protein [Paenibacillus macquariensis]MEC0093340.1 stalk domain-containing protein [Paenibacillus macquariensis]OAB27504.1 glycosyl hydrolase [Paenibacillus macquariensis subsp. macquariensis]SIR42192.1 Glycosyl hydrolases family 18 [Paenibacillus macquariensis]